MFGILTFLKFILGGLFALGIIALIVGAIIVILIFFGIRISFSINFDLSELLYLFRIKCKEVKR